MSDPDSWASLRSALSLLSIGTVLVASIVVGAALGYWLDEMFETQPWLLIVGFTLGAIAGFIQMTRILKRFAK